MSRSMVGKPIFKDFDPYWRLVVSVMPNTGVATDGSPFPDYSDQGMNWNPGTLISVSLPTYQSTYPLFNLNTLYLGSYWIQTGGTLSENNPLTSIGTNDITIEGWWLTTAYPTSSSYHTLFSNDNTAGIRSWCLDVSNPNSNKVRFFVYIGATQFIVLSTAAPSLNTWHHIAAVRYGNTILLYLDGILQNTTSITAGSMNATTLPVAIGARFNGSAYQYSGSTYVGPTRVTVGKARYTGASFTVPGGPFPLQ